LKGITTKKYKWKTIFRIETTYNLKGITTSVVSGETYI